MYKKRLTFLLLLISVTSFQFLFSQNLPYTLLWRISGNGLKKSSYLFGTMHLTDERIFNLGDSLYRAIEHCEGLAIEIDPQAFTPLAIDETQKEIDNKNIYLKDIMPRDKFEKYGKMIAKKLKKSPDDLTTSDVLNQENRWITESFQTGKMETFLDTYLYDIARRLGKWTGGVEDLNDQENLVDEVDESDIEQLALYENDSANVSQDADQGGEYLIQDYLRNDLNAIDSLSNTQDSAYEDRLLFRRNIKMARRMDSLSRLRSMVFAVGAAHLPGKKGLIALLKEKGFTVTPVFSSKTLKPSDYKVADVPLKWYNVKDTEDFYSVSMPGKPGDLMAYGIMKMKMYFDVFSSTVYMTLSMKTPFGPSMADSIFQKIVSRYSGIADLDQITPITVHHMPGKEFLSTKGNYTHGYYLFKDGQIYLAMGTSIKKDQADTGEIDRFLHSFYPMDHSAAVQPTYTYTDSLQAYKVELPSEPKSAADFLGNNKDEEIDRELLMAGDPITGNYFFLGINEAAPGYFIANDSVMLAGLGEKQRVLYKKIITDSLYRSKGTWMMDMEGMMTQLPLRMRAHYQYRGNRWYSLVAMYDTAKAHIMVDRFFHSFTPLNYETQNWTNYTSPDTVFSTWAPTKFTYNVLPLGEDVSPGSTYTAYDSTRGDSYTVVEMNFSKYFWQNSDSALWKQLIKGHVGKDSLLLCKTISNGLATGYELQTQKSGSSDIKRGRMILNGDKLYFLVASEPPSEIINENTNKFFNSFRLKSLQPNLRIFESKADIILRDLASKDSASYEKAYQYLGSVPFTRKDLPKLQEALLKRYPEDSIYTYRRTNKKIEEIILGLKDSSTFHFAQIHYLKADGRIKSLLLDVMASYPSKVHFDIIKTLLLKQPPAETPGYALANKFMDTLSLTATILPDLLPLLKDSVMAPFVITLTDKLLNHHLLDFATLCPYQSELLDISRKYLSRIKADPGNYPYTDFNFENLMGRFNKPSFNSALQDWSLSPANFLALNSICILLRNHQNVNPLVLSALAKDLNTRSDLYDTLLVYHKAKLFPKPYCTQQSLGESYVYIAASDDDPSAIRYVSQKVINFQGRPSRFYFYKLTLADSSTGSNVLSCAGPFDLNAKVMPSVETFAEIYDDEDFDSTHLSRQMDAIIKQMEDGFKWKSPVH